MILPAGATYNVEKMKANQLFAHPLVLSSTQTAAVAKRSIQVTHQAFEEPLYRVGRWEPAWLACMLPQAKDHMKSFGGVLQWSPSVELCVGPTT